MIIYFFKWLKWWFWQWRKICIGKMNYITLTLSIASNIICQVENVKILVRVYSAVPLGGCRSGWTPRTKERAILKLKINQRRTVTKNKANYIIVMLVEGAVRKPTLFSASWPSHNLQQQHQQQNLHYVNVSRQPNFLSKSVVKYPSYRFILKQSAR